jgi:glycosyltransferase involved in cell wall biosynthesis
VRVLVAHNFYQQPGGEDVSYRAEVELLRQHGHDVLCFEQHNDAIDSMGRLPLATRTLWNRGVSRDFGALVRRERPDIVHLHNTFPLLSPAAAVAAHSAGVPVVQTLHNFRLICANAQLYRDGQTCEECVDRLIPWPAIQHRCYRNDLTATSVVAAMTSGHRLLRTWLRSVDRFIVLSNDGLSRIRSSGIPRAKFVVKPNFVSPDPGVGDGTGGYLLYIGRLAPEKGIQTLLRAWSSVRAPITLKIAGSGPLEPEVMRAAALDPRIEFLGWRDGDEILTLLKGAAALLFTSEWYEGLPISIIESLAVGTPVICARLGAMQEIIADERTGIHFTPGDARDLAIQIDSAVSRPNWLDSMRPQARREFEGHYTAERNYALLMEIYRGVLDARASK